MGLNTMRDMVTKNSSKRVVAEKSKVLRANLPAIIQAGGSLFFEQAFFTIVDDIKYNLLKLSGEWGVSDDPVDESILIVLGSFDPGNPPSANDGIFLNSNFWIQTITYRAVGTPSNVLNTLNYVDHEFDKEGELFADDPQFKQVLGMAAFSSTTSSVHRSFRLDWKETYIQRSFTDPVGEWSGYTDEEVWGS